MSVLTSPYHFESQGAQKNWNTTNIFQWSTAISSGSALQSIRMPPSTSSNRLHLFAASVTPSVLAPDGASGPIISVRRARFTSRWADIDGLRTQAVEVTLANLAPQSTFASGSVTAPFLVDIVGFGVTTISPGVINRLVASDQVRVDILVTVSDTNPGGDASVRIKDANGNILGTSDGWPVTPLRQEWTSEAQVLGTHETPTWVRRGHI